MTQRIFRNRARLEKLQEIIRTAGLEADAGKLKPAEGLSFDNGAGDPAIDVKIADAKLSCALCRYAPVNGKKRRRSRRRPSDSRSPDAWSKSSALMTDSTGPKISS